MGTIASAAMRRSESCGMEEEREKKSEKRNDA